MPRPVSMLMMFLIVLLAVTSALWFYAERRSCPESWVCTAWSSCVNGQQTRSCLDERQCGTTINKPTIAQRCDAPPQPQPFCGDSLCSGDETCASCFDDCGVCAEPKISVTVGLPERIFDSTTDHCGDTPIEGPDIPVRAIKNYRGEIVLISGNAPDNYAMFGTSFDDLQRDCTTPVFRSEDKWSITDFAPQQWLHSVHTDDGRIVHGLVHNEYHDPYASNCNPGETMANQCWYNFVTAVKSTDGGRTFTHLPGAQKVVAILPTQWDPNDPGSPIINQRGETTPAARPDPHGYFSPNFIKKDNYYYSTFGATFFPNTGKRGTCIMRTATPDDPHSWKMWDGQEFTLPYFNPYPHEPHDPEHYRCALISPDTLWDSSGPIAYSTYLEQYTMVIPGIYEWQGRGDTCGIWYSLSDDLIHWKKPKLIIKTKFDFYPQCEPTGFKGGYPSLIDHDSTDPSFETIGQTPYLYYVLGEVPGKGSFSILERRKLTFTKT